MSNTKLLKARSWAISLFSWFIQLNEGREDWFFKCWQLSIVAKHLDIFNTSGLKTKTKKKNYFHILCKSEYLKFYNLLVCWQTVLFHNVGFENAH